MTDLKTEALPPLPMHPDARAWTQKECESLRAYGTECIAAALASTSAPAEQTKDDEQPDYTDSDFDFLVEKLEEIGAQRATSAPSEPAAVPVAALDPRGNCTQCTTGKDGECVHCYAKAGERCQYAQPERLRYVSAIDPAMQAKRLVKCAQCETGCLGKCQKEPPLTRSGRFPGGLMGMPALRVAHITLDGTTLTVPADQLAALGLGDGDNETYTLTFATMTQDAYEALGEFDGF